MENRPLDVDDYRMAFAHVISLITKYKQIVENFQIIPNNEEKLQDIISSIKKCDNKNDDIFEVLNDLETHVIPSIMHLNHPQFRSDVPIGSNYLSILVEILVSGLNINNLNWTENDMLQKFEFHVTDMFGKALHLPCTLLYEDSMHCGGGIMQNTEYDAVFLSMLTARNRVLRILQNDPLVSPVRNLSRLVCYASEYANTSVIRAANLLQVKIHLLKTDENQSLTTKAIEGQILKDVNQGLYPFFIFATIGTMECGSIDQLPDISRMVKKHRYLWYHVSAPYASPILMLPEFECLTKGLQYCDSFDCTPSYWCLTSSNCTCLWLKKRQCLKDAFNQDFKKSVSSNTTKGTSDNTTTFYSLVTNDLKNNTNFMGSEMYERKGYDALKLWFTLKCYGKNFIQNRVREHIRLTRFFEDLLKKDDLFVVQNNVIFGVVCFSLKQSSKLEHLDFDQCTVELLSILNKSNKIYLSGTTINEKFAIKFYLGHEYENEENVTKAYNIIETITREYLNKLSKCAQSCLKTGEVAAEQNSTCTKVETENKSHELKNGEHLKDLLFEKIKDIANK